MKLGGKLKLIEIQMSVYSLLFESFPDPRIIALKPRPKRRYTPSEGLSLSIASLFCIIRLLSSHAFEANFATASDSWLALIEIIAHK